MTATDPVASESGSDAGVFRFTRTASTASALTVSYSVGGTATNGVDYSTISGTIVIPATQSFADLAVSAIVDGMVEGAETVVVTVTDTAAYDPGSPASATVTIGDQVDPCAGGGGALINGATHCGTIRIAGETELDVHRDGGRPDCRSHRRNHRCQRPPSLDTPHRAQRHLSR